ncbi:MAG: SBBP repeat-containing protein [Bryobacteraceae bacterium]|jgi:uncharacterized protein (TIGR03437 family)
MRKIVVPALLACAALAHAASYSTYIGDANPYQVSAIATDAGGNTYITGSRVIMAATTDIFAGKLDPSGNLTLLATFSGKGTDHANGIAVDPSGNIYIAGNTTSTDFPLHNPLQSVPFGGSAGVYSGTGFLMKLTADGTPVYATYLGGAEGYSSLAGVAADAVGNAYVIGTTAAQDYPYTPGMPAASVSDNGIFDFSGAFFAKINPTGSQILYAGALTGPVPGCETTVEGSSCFLQSSPTTGAAIAVDPAGNAYIAGSAGMGLPTTSGVLRATGIGAFVAKVNFAGNGLDYVTYLGPGNLNPATGTVATDFISAIAADAAGNVYLSGATSDPSFPVTAGAFQTSLAGPGSLPYVSPPDAFVAKLNPAGSAMVWATLLGGTATDAAQALATDSAGDVWVSGITGSTNFPTVVSVTPGGSEFLAELNPTGTALSYAALWPGNTVAQALAVDASGMVHAAGANGIVSAFPADAAPGTTPDPWMFGVTNAAGGVLSGRLAPGELIAIYGLHMGPAAPLWAVFDAKGFLPTTLGALQVTIDGTPAPLLYVSATQINAIAPVELTSGSAVELQVMPNGAPLPDFRVMVDLAAPGVFLNADGGAAAINQDGTVNSQANPAPVGSFVAIWATGTGYFHGRDGQLAPGANEFCAAGLILCEILQSDGTQANVTYSGAAPGMVNGVVQVNFQATASQSYYLDVNGIDSAPFGLYTTPRTP